MALPFWRWKSICQTYLSLSRHQLVLEEQKSLLPERSSLLITAAQFTTFTAARGSSLSATVIEKNRSNKEDKKSAAIETASASVPPKRTPSAEPQNFPRDKNSAGAKGELPAVEEKESRTRTTKAMSSSKTMATEKDLGKNGEEMCKKGPVIPMVSGYVHKVLFGSESDAPGLLADTEKSNQRGFHIPSLHGNSLPEHFEAISRCQSQPYFELLNSFCRISTLPRMPRKWKLLPGWAKYYEDGSHSSVEYPEEDVIVLDVETCVQENGIPVMATAVSASNWYSWCSSVLWKQNSVNVYELDSLIPLGISDKHRIVVGHNVGFDRARVKEEYFVESGKLRFWDTMSMHIAICGLTSDQQAMYAKLNKEEEPEDAKTKGWLKKWKGEVSKNNLADVQKLHCPRSNQFSISKEPRQFFTKGSLKDIREHFQVFQLHEALLCLL